MAGTRPERVYHQDYIARIRYSNTLPPPPNPPKLLDIPGTGLAGGQYTSAAFASRLAREQPLNIEADAELGMPIDLVGLPGVFEGDERAILARDPAPTLHPHDRALLKPLSALGKPTSMNAGVSFLRRTEYISSSQGGQRFESSTSKDLLRVRNDGKRKRKPNVNKDDPINIIRALVKGFDVAYPADAYKGEDSQTNIRGAEITTEDQKAWNNPKHPTKPQLELLDAYPLMPDFDAIPPLEAYQVTKFSVNPTRHSDGYDHRLDVALLRPTNVDLVKYEERVAAREEDPSLPKPLPEYEYDLFLTHESSVVKGIKRKFDVNDPDRDDESLYERETESGRVFSYQYVREYETYQQAGDPDDMYGDTIALALHDPDMDTGAVEGAAKRLAKGAYYYPIKQRTNLRPKRKNARRQQADDSQHVDVIVGTVRDQDIYEQHDRLKAHKNFDPSIELPQLPEAQDQTQEDTQGQAEGEADRDADADRDGDADADVDADADGDDADE